MLNGNPGGVENWSTAGSNRLVIRGLLMYLSDDYGMDTVWFGQMVKDKKIEIYDELAPYRSALGNGMLEGSKTWRLSMQGDVRIR